jgi:hypothetical protein
MLVIGLYVINVGYGFEGSLSPLGRFTFVSRTLTGAVDDDEVGAATNRFSHSWAASIPIPLPKNYLLGIDLQQKDFEDYGHRFYLSGVWSDSGWWYYYLYALSIKVPLGTWLLLILAIGAGRWTSARAAFRDEVFLLAPPVMLLVIVSSQTGLNEHMRYVLPVLPFVFIWVSRIVPAVATRSWPARATTAQRLSARLVLLAACWSTLSSLLWYPHCLSYFNEIVGGGRQGWKHLVNSNIDWGQDLLYLKQWSDAHPDSRPLRMALFGTIDPQLVDIDGTTFAPYAQDSELQPGFYAVSATILAGSGLNDSPQRLAREVRRCGVHDAVGGTITIFEKE